MTSLEAPPRLADVDSEVTLVGGGRMGMALLSGWLRAGLKPVLVHVADPRPSPELQALARRHGLAVTAAIERQSDVVVLAVKPQIIDAVAKDMAGLIGQGGLVLSIMAGIRIPRLQELFPAASGWVRAMPNLPASVGCGATALYAECPRQQRDLATRLMVTVGHVEWLPHEDLMDAATALSGSGPGYLLYVVECLASAGEKAGLPPETAQRLARATMYGTGMLLNSSERTAAELRAAVTSPGGTTQSGLDVLSSEIGLPGLLAKAVLAARDRSRQLSR